MIIDSHSHIFPNLEGASSGKDLSHPLLYLQKFVSESPAQAVRRIKDNAVVEDRTKWALWDPSDPGPNGAYDVNFRLGEFGRLAWTKDGTDYFMHLYAPSLQKIASPPEFLLAEMDYAGVGMAVLQNAWIYGQMNDYFAEAIKKYPGRFVGSVQVSEAFADSDVQIRELRRGVLDLGLKALYFANARFFENGYSSYFDDPKYHPFWDEVRNLGIPVYWDLVALKEAGQSADTPYERFSHQMKRFENWRKHYPEMGFLCVISGMAMSC
jgi:predicted TIM-barrel fold metal-dependent hydrolase